MESKSYNAEILQFCEQILASHKTNGGSTFCCVTGKSLAGEDCYAVSTHPECEYKSTLEPDARTIALFIIKNLGLLSISGYAVGTWQEAGLHYLDVVTLCYDRQTAIELGRCAKQIAICYLKDCSIIPLK
jgi:hypothetical protein